MPKEHQISTIRLKEYFDSGDPEQLFTLEEEIASGSFGAVYKGRHIQNGQRYAVKIITPEEDEVLEDFLVEISILKRCKHDTIVGFMGAWYKGEELFIAMELCEGGSVSDIFQILHEPLSEDQIAVITYETLRGLDYLHKVGIIHRDIKGANILLTNAGDIKLVDFGVSAELKKPGERRNTLIGTPYWMAPEVIANKTGNYPYDAKADMWSLGITLLELAEMNPPLHEIHPMKALMMIPMRDPPTFTHPDKWGKEFRDFVNTCLQKQPEKRKSAEEFLSHPFPASNRGKNVLVELINRRRKAEQKSQDGAQDLDNDDLSDSDDEVNPNRNSGGDSIYNTSPTSPVPVKIQIPSINDAVKSESPTTSTVGTPKKTNSAPQPTNSSDSIGLPPVHMSSSPKSSDTRIPTSRKSLKPTNPNRPTYRTGKNLTKRDIKEHEKQMVNRQLMKDQMKQVRNLKQNQQEAMEKLLRNHQREAEQLGAKFEESRKDRQRAYNKNVEASTKKHKTELDNLNKQQQNNIKNIQKQHQNTLKQTIKQTDNDAKQKIKEFKESIKATTKETLKEKEKSKTFSKKDLKDLKLNQERDNELEELIFAHKQVRVNQQQEFDQRMMLLEQDTKVDREELNKKHEALKEQMKQLHQLHLEFGKINFEVEFYLQKHPVELRQLSELQQLEKTQLTEQQTTEFEQQKVLLSNDQKAQRKAHLKSQQQTQAEFQNKVKAMQKDPKYKDKKLFKETAQAMKDEVVKKLEKENAELEERLKKQRQDEEELIKKHHNSKLEQQRLEQEELATKRRTEQAQQSTKAQEDYDNAVRALILKQNTEVLALRLELHKEVKDFVNVHQKEVEDIWKLSQGEQIKLLESQHQEEIALRTKQKRDAADLEKAAATHAEELKLMQQKQTKELDVLTKTHAQAQLQVEEQLATDRKNLEEELIKSGGFVPIADAPPGSPRVDKH